MKWWAGTGLNRRHQDFQSPQVSPPSPHSRTSSTATRALLLGARSAWNPIPTDAVVSLGPSSGRVAVSGTELTRQSSEQQASPDQGGMRSEGGVLFPARPIR